MERYPFENCLCFYASSVEDVRNSRGVVKAANAEIKARLTAAFVQKLESNSILSPVLKMAKRIDALVEKVIPSSTQTHNSDPYGGMIFLSVVRHFPDQDPTSTADLLTVSDVTGSLVMHIPSRLQQKLLNAIIKEAGGFPTDYSVIKRQSWCSDIILMATYRDLTHWEHGLSRITGDKEEEYTLMYVLNRYANQGESEKNSFLQKLAIAIPTLK